MMETEKKQIEELTPDQEALIDEVKEEWRKLGLSTEPSTEQQMRDAVDLSYRCAEQKLPTHYYFFDSPFAGSLAVALLKLQHPDGDKVQPYSSEELATKVKELQQMDKLPDDVRELAQDAVQWARYGQHDADWLAFYDYFRQIGVEGLDSLNGFFATARHCGWWWPMPKIAVITKKPVELHIDDQGWLHREDGKAIVYADGWGRYCWHGVSVKENAILQPATITDELLTETLAAAETKAQKIQTEADLKAMTLPPNNVEEHRDTTKAKIAEVRAKAQQQVVTLKDRRAHYQQSLS